MKNTCVFLIGARNKFYTLILTLSFTPILISFGPQLHQQNLVEGIRSSKETSGQICRARGPQRKKKSQQLTITGLTEPQFLTCSSLQGKRQGKIAMTKLQRHKQEPRLRWYVIPCPSWAGILTQIERYSHRCDRRELQTDEDRTSGDPHSDPTHTHTHKHGFKSTQNFTKPLDSTVRLILTSCLMLLTTQIMLHLLVSTHSLSLFRFFQGRFKSWIQGKTFPGHSDVLLKPPKEGSAFQGSIPIGPRLLHGFTVFQNCLEKVSHSPAFLLQGLWKLEGKKKMEDN